MLDRKKWGRWLLLVILAIASALFEAAGALLVFALLGAIVDSESALELPLIGDIQTLVPAAYRDQIVVFMIAITAVFFLVRAGVLLFQAYVQNRVVQNAGLRLSHTLFSGYLQLPYILHVQRNSAESIRNIFHTVAEMVTHVLLPGVRLLSEAFLVAAVLVVLFATHAVATVGAIFILGVAVYAVLRSIRPRLTELGRRSQVVSKQSVQSIQQGLENLREIRIFGAENSFRKEFFRSHSELARTRYLRQVLSDIPRLAVETFAVFFILSVLLFAVVGNESVGGALPVIGLFGYAILRLLPSINRIVVSVSSIHFGGAGIEDLYRDLMVVKEFTAGFSQEDEHPDRLILRRALELENVGFQYPNTSRPALSGVTMSVRRGESIGVVGETGSGKSTLIDVMCGILRPTSGHVRVDGRDINLALRAWYASIGVVPQAVVLIDDSLRKNVALGVDEEDIDESVLTESLEIAQLTDVVANLPEGLDTNVGERGIRLSGGQRQRIAIARALYRQPDVLFFDEGTSALDSSTEELVIEGLKASGRVRTFVMIAHRLTTVRHCDRIVVMDDGRMEGIGPYQSLARDNSVFRRLVASDHTDSKAV